MPEEKNKGAVPTPPPAVPKPRFTNSKTSGIEPGQLRGVRRDLTPPEPEEDPATKLKKEIAKMTATEFKTFKNDPRNVQRLRELGIAK